MMAGSVRIGREGSRAGNPGRTWRDPRSLTTLRWDPDKGVVIILQDVPQFEKRSGSYSSNYDYEIHLGVDKVPDLLKVLVRGVDAIAEERASLLADLVRGAAPTTVKPE